MNWKVKLGIGLVILSLFLYLLHFTIFHDPHHIFIYLLGDIAFVPFEVLLVTLIIHQLLQKREKRIIMEKLNMLIGVFFSELGTTLLTYLSDHDPQIEIIRDDLIIRDNWTDEDFQTVARKLRRYNYDILLKRENIKDLRPLLLNKIGFLTRLLENPNLLEHETFTELLRATFHLAEELASRKEIRRLPESDIKHLIGDVKRVYGLLVSEWVAYMEHLKNNFPYLFSLAMRINPFDQQATPIVV
ncbi:MAG TPA: hypothetical protein EYP58_03880 [bacterium (Candidatus Stahlbacteria)]|nr:hypothetical protein [Candidatus Stahlbacteria bacterium]